LSSLAVEWPERSIHPEPLGGLLFRLEIAPIRYPITDDPGEAFVLVLTDFVKEMNPI